ncbi:hypothetical protein ABW21_db0209867 [Orbilia brochopaga]|nr:hypothetical protein ABW21_db0209867 [Drechslerella brochopaga]
MVNINSLPNEILLNVFGSSDLDFEDGSRIALVCSLWRQIVDSVRYKTLLTEFPSDNFYRGQEERLELYRKNRGHVREFTLRIGDCVRGHVRQHFNLKEYALNLSGFTRITEFTLFDEDGSGICWVMYKCILGHALSSLPNLKTLNISRTLEAYGNDASLLSIDQTDPALKLLSAITSKCLSSLKRVRLEIDVCSDQSLRIFYAFMTHTLDVLGPVTCQNAKFALIVKLINPMIMEPSNNLGQVPIEPEWKIDNLEELQYRNHGSQTPPWEVISTNFSNVKYLALGPVLFTKVEAIMHSTYGTDTGSETNRPKELKEFSVFKNTEILAVKGKLLPYNSIPGFYAVLFDYFPKLQSLRFRKTGHLIEFRVNQQPDGSKKFTPKGRLLNFYESNLDLFSS